jgi:hypothetical protein
MKALGKFLRKNRDWQRRFMAAPVPAFCGQDFFNIPPAPAFS